MLERLIKETLCAKISLKRNKGQQRIKHHSYSRGNQYCNDHNDHIYHRQEQPQGFFFLTCSPFSDSLWFRSKHNMLLTVLSHCLDDAAAIRAEPGAVGSRQTPSEAAAGIPASKRSVKPNKPELSSSSLSLGNLSALAAKNKELRSAASRFNNLDSRRLKNLCVCLGFITCAFHHLVNAVVVETRCTPTTL